jgi:TPR repeat protein
MVVGVHAVVPRVQGVWLVLLAPAIPLVLCAALFQSLAARCWFFALAVALSTLLVQTIASALKKGELLLPMVSLILAASWVPLSVNTLRLYFAPATSSPDPMVLLLSLAPWVLIVASVAAGIFVCKSPTSGAKGSMSVVAFVLVVVLGSVSASGQVSNHEQELATVKKQAEAGDVKAQVQLGLAYASGDGVEADGKQAVKWFRKAADREDAAGEYYLGELYATGRGVPVDYSEALKWLRKAAEQGEPHAQYNLAAIYTQGLGVDKDDYEAAKWMRKAADQGLPDGQFGLGSMCAHGKGVPQSVTEAVAWYRKAADQGDTPAMNNLAMLFATSSDPKVRNPKEAVSLGEKVVELEPNNASYLDTLATAYFEAEQLDKAVEAERRALTLKPDNPAYKKALEKYQSAAQPTPTTH